MTAPPLPYEAVRRPGRPTDYSPEIAAVICDRLATGESVRAIARDETMPAMSTVFLWLAKHQEFSEQYARACEIRAFVFAEEIVAISDDGSNDTYVDDNGNERTDQDVIARSKLRVDTRKWLMARMSPKKYGDKITQEVQGAGGGPVLFQTIYEPANS